MSKTIAFVDLTKRTDHVEAFDLLPFITKFDGWAIRCDPAMLSEYLHLSPPEARLGAIIAPFCADKEVSPHKAWTAVIFFPVEGRPTPKNDTERDFMLSSSDPRNQGMPADYAFWLFSVLRMRRTDDFYDICPGDGSASLAWEAFKNLPVQIGLFKKNLDNDDGGVLR